MLPFCLIKDADEGLVVFSSLYHTSSAHRTLTAGIMRGVWMLFLTLSVGGLTGPYVDSMSTLALWHFDSPSGSASTPASSSVLTTPLVLSGSASFGSMGHPWFGLSGNTGVPTNFPPPSGFTPLVSPIAVSQLTNPMGQFTWEAMIWLDSLAVEGTAARQILSLEADSGADRYFQFRISVPTDPTTASVQFIRLNPGPTQAISAAIPNTGPDALIAQEWFHVAASYDGSEMEFFWTKVRDDAEMANSIGSSTLSPQVAPSGSGTLGIATEFKTNSSPDESLRGLIDEVRISNTNLSAFDFIFALPVLE